MADYPAAVAELATLGDENLGKEWLDYRARGIGPEHVPDLIRLARQWVESYEADSEAAIWAPLHAWRALGQLRAVEAVEPLLAILDLDQKRDGDWASDEIPEVISMIGPPALPALAAALPASWLGAKARCDVIGMVVSIAQRHPATRGECVASLVERLKVRGEGEDEAFLNAVAVGALIELKAARAAPDIERAYLMGAVDESFGANWPVARYLLGLGPRPAGRGSPKDRAKQRSRDKRKAAEQSKKRNRRKE